MTNAVMQGNSNTTAITNALERTTMQFANALQQTIQMGVDAQAQENKNAKMDKQFEKVKVFDGSKPSECHPWLEEVHTLCIQTGRPFHEMLLLCVGQAVRDFITDMSPEAMDDQIKNDLITGYSDLQGLGYKQSADDSIMQRPDKPLRSYIMRYSRLFKLLNGTAPDDVKMRTTSMHFINSLHNYLSSKVENRLLGMNEKNYSLGDTFKVALECELKAIAWRDDMGSTPQDRQTRWSSSSPSRYCSLKRLARYTCATQTIKVKITTQIFRQSMRKQHTQLPIMASSNKTHLQ